MNNENLLLTIELVPTTVFFSNVRNSSTPRVWNTIRTRCYHDSSNQCDICTDIGTNQGYKHKVDCHEIWKYETRADGERWQTLIGFTSLCPKCHEAKHAGLAYDRGNIERVQSWLAEINETTMEEASDYILAAFNEHRERSKHDWKLDTSYVKTYFEN